MFRREFLATGSAVGATALAGCGSLESRAIEVPSVLDDRPEAIYVPGHVEGMDVVGIQTSGDYAVALSYSYPHRFWTITGTDAERTSIDETDSVHLMATVWDPETGMVLPDVGVAVEITRDGSLVSEETVYAMLSQPMGVHHGANFAGLEDGENYEVAVRVGATASRPTGAFAGRFDEPATATFEFTFEESAMREIRFDRLDRGGERDALDPMAMERVPTGIAPTAEELPGETVTAMAADVRYVATIVEPPAGVDGEGAYLAVSPRTRYNGYALSRMGLAVAPERDGQKGAKAELTRTIDPDLGYHYGTTLPREGNQRETTSHDGGEVSISVETPPQVARHEGYETAFFDVPTVTLSL
ncbi:hypothetical protein [Halorhabdus sp. BNX81]|uniref:DUF7350 domain-containing protein n=1 Tax=Halorhabdus sp. BNX81 TaxID=2980181 RepID=UPI0023DD6272|nr:hypothetical protein [Halorhabdus sp. BNX81]WEL20145.1 Uncharacterized protein probably involved in high-affinity Fe2 transport [Halorhabdus sp. BNX81]